MTRLIIKLGKWLESRFPEKVIVTAQDYQNLNTELSLLRSTLNDNALSLNTALERLSVVEKSAAHTEAVRELVKAVKTLNDDYLSFKASMGFRQGTVKAEEIQALLNGEII